MKIVRKYENKLEKIIVKEKEKEKKKSLLDI